MHRARGACFSDGWPPVPPAGGPAALQTASFPPAEFYSLPSSFRTEILCGVECQRAKRVEEACRPSLPSDPKRLALAASRGDIAPPAAIRSSSKSHPDGSFAGA